MRRGKKTSIPASLVVPALRTRSAAKEPEVPADTSPAGSAAAAAAPGGSSCLRDPFQVARPESKPPSARLRGPVGEADAASALGSESVESQEPPPPPPPLPPATQNSVDCGQSAPGLALEPDKMFNIFRSIPTQMDYKGQKLAEQIFQGIILVSAVIGFIYGYITEQFGWTVYIVMAGFALSCLLTLPPWPIYRRNPLKWLPVQEPITDDKKPADRKVKRHSKN
ncbi:signal peptidase complex subunit 1 [Paroedura picta]|uniref:signal peptidase complex subunit 1 n=1 Tax=Paroedura picta TaxID=143630 RepID=UPI004056C86C